MSCGVNAMVREGGILRGSTLISSGTYPTKRACTANGVSGIEGNTKNPSTFDFVPKPVPLMTMMALGSRSPLFASFITPWSGCARRPGPSC